MKRIAALALVAALGATAASADEIKPVTSTQLTTAGVLGGAFGGLGIGTIGVITLSATILLVGVMDANSSGTN